MKIQKSKYPIFGFMFCMVLLQYSCKQETTETKPDYTGKTLISIESNIIKLEGGDQIVLNEDSIAKVFYLVRHAEKDTSVEVEPPLTEAGLQRATKIADIMRGTRVDAIYSTMTIRTMFTVDSLADIKAMKILPYENKGLKALLDDIQTSQDYNRIFIVGHSNTIPSITNTLAGKQVFTKTFDENDYGNFVIVVQNKSGTKDAYALRY
mgnify:CR=1 FL=1